MSLNQTAYHFPGQTAVVTGASGGIGSACARHLAAAGAFVFLHANQNQQAAQDVLVEIKKAGGNGAVLTADLADASQLDELIRTFDSEINRIDILVNAAGVDLMSPTISSLDYCKKLHKIFEIDVFATIRLSRHVAVRMKRQGKGQIFFFGWDGVDYGWMGETGELYGTAKGALLGFCRSFAETSAPEVRIRLLSLGWIKTRWGEKASAEYERRIRTDSLRDRWGYPDEVANTVLFLANECSDYVDGINIKINGGKRGTKF